MQGQLTNDILLIEDDVDTRANLRDILELDGYQVAEAGTAAETLGRNDLTRFGSIILDRSLPDAPANELLPELKKRAPGAAIVIVTGFSDLQSAVDAIRQGATDYILKPLNPDALRASLTRIAERRELTLAKERSEKAFRQLVEMAEALIVILRPDNRIVYLSPHAERITGYSADEVQGRDFMHLFVKEHARPDFSERLGASVSGVSLPGFQEPIVCRDGTERWIVWNSRYLDNYENEPAILGIGQDVTVLRQAQERLLQSERLAAIGQVVTGLAHESRNALQRSQACLEMLSLQIQDRPAALDLLSRLQKAQNHLHYLYEGVRHYAAPINLERSNQNLREIWREAWTNLSASRQHRHIDLVEQLDDTDLSCDVDRFRIGQVFHNVLDNALAASPDGSKIVIRARSTTMEGKSALEIRISDDGPGIHPEKSQQVFDPFFTTKTKGTGLGLAIVKRIVEAHDGRIALAEDSNVGAEFVITVPRILT